MTVMGNRTKSRIDAVFFFVSKQAADEEALSHWARYLCVLSSGLVEVSIKSILTEYVRHHSNQEVMNHVESRLESLTNVNEEKVFQLLISFNPKWGEQFRQKRTDVQKAALDSVIANRNLIAHGSSVGLTMARIRDYYREIVSILKLIEGECVK